MIDFQRLAHDVDDLAAPEFDFDAIRKRSACTSAPVRTRRTVLGIFTLALVLPALALGAVRLLPHVYERGNMVDIYATRVDAQWRTNPAMLAKLARRAPYRVILPTALPARAKLKSAMIADLTLISVTYQCPGKATAQFLIGPARLRTLLHPPKDPYASVTVRPPPHLRWQTFTAGNENVRVGTNCLTAEELARVRSAMIAAGAWAR